MSDITPEQYAAALATKDAYEATQRAADLAALTELYAPVVSIIQSDAFTDLRAGITAAITAYNGNTELELIHGALKSARTCLENLATVVVMKAPRNTPVDTIPVPTPPED